MEPVRLGLFTILTDCCIIKPVAYRLPKAQLDDGLTRRSVPQDLLGPHRLCLSKGYAKASQDGWADTSRPSPLFDCPTMPRGEYANT
jgi:hypothetical protein